MVLRRFPQQILNHCIDDIEQLVLRIKASAEAWKKLQKKRRVKAGGAAKTAGNHANLKADLISV